MDVALTYKTRGVQVLAEQFDGSMQMAERYGLKYGMVHGEGECWWSKGIGVVCVGDWLVTPPDSKAPMVFADGRFSACYELVPDVPVEDPKDLALRVAGDRIRELEHELAQMTDQARRAREVVREQPAPPPPATTDWYSCVVCSHKTNEFPVSQMTHACCLGTARVAPCCEKAVRLSPGIVGDVLAASNHRPDCKTPR